MKAKTMSKAKVGPYPGLRMCAAVEPEGVSFCGDPIASVRCDRGHTQERFAGEIAIGDEMFCPACYWSDHGDQTKVHIPWPSEAAQVMLKDEASPTEIYLRAKGCRWQAAHWERLAKSPEWANHHEVALAQAESHRKGAESLEALLKE